MKKPRYIIGLVGLIAVIILIVIIAWPNNKEADSTLVVYSADQELKLNIPVSALPAGVNQADLKITDATAELTSEEQALGMKRVYMLEPAGIRFKEPIDLSLSFAREEEPTLPIITHQSEHSFEVLSDAGYQVADNDVTLNTKIDHFSQVTRIEVPFEFNFIGGGEYGLGESFTFDIVVEPKVGKDGRYLAIYYTEKVESDISDAKTEVADDDSVPALDEEKNYLALARPQPWEGWEVMPFKITASEGLIPTEVTSPGDKSEAYNEVILTTNYTCAKEGDHIISIPDGIPMKFIIKWDKELPFLKDKQIQEGTNDYSKYWEYAVQATHWVDHRYHWERLGIKCWEHEMIHIGPPYFIDCGGGKILSGMSQGDARTGEQIIDADGNPIDFETGKPVKCE